MVSFKIKLENIYIYVYIFFFSQLFCLCIVWAKCEPCGGASAKSGTPPHLVSLIHVDLNVSNSRAEGPLRAQGDGG